MLMMGKQWISQAAALGAEIAYGRNLFLFTA